MLSLSEGQRFGIACVKDEFLFNLSIILKAQTTVKVKNECLRKTCKVPGG